MTDDQTRERGKWRLNREVSAGDLVAISVAVVAVLTSYFSLDKRVAVIETLSAQQQSAVSQTVQEIKHELRRLTDKIERLTERRP